MSAFVVSHNHINTLLTYANKNGLNFYFGEDRVLRSEQTADLQTLAEMLLAENVASVNARYPDTVNNPQDMPGVIVEVGCQITFRFTRNAADLTPLQILKACRCFDYQACETDDWKESDARRVIDYIESRAINDLPGYDSAKWEID